MKCKYCRKQIKDYYVICPECGEALVENVELSSKLKSHLHVNNPNERYDKLRADNTEIIKRHDRLMDNMHNGHISEDGIYPHEVVLLTRLDYLVKNVQTRMYRYLFGFGIVDVQAVLNMLEERGFIKVDFPLSMQRMSLAKLKEILEPYNTDGDFKAAAQRALQEEPIEVLNELFPIQFYILTEQGKVALKNNKYVIDMLSDDYDSEDIWRANRLLYDEPDMTAEVLRKKIVAGMDGKGYNKKESNEGNAENKGCLSLDSEQVDALVKGFIFIIIVVIVIIVLISSCISK